MSTTTQVTALPPCDICTGQTARYDAMTYTGQWGYMCHECFKEHGVGLGLGKGQELILCK